MKTPLAFGVIGAGYFGKHYVRLLQDMPGAVLRAVADRSGRAVGESGVLLSLNVRRYTDAHDVLSDSSIDCVVIATPASTHHALALAALSAGKHALVEKPMAMNMEEAEDIRKAAEKSKTIFMVGHQYLYHDYVRVLKQKMDEGLLGAVRYVHAEHFSFGPIRPGIGCFWEMAVHECAIIDFLFSPGAVRDATGRSVDFLQSGREDFASAQITFENGLTAAITVSWFAPEKIRRITIAGDRGMAVFDDRREEKLKFFLRPYPIPDGEDTSSAFMAFSASEIMTPAVAAREPLRNQLDHFISCVRTGTEPASGISHGMRVMRLLDATRRVLIS
ncbi:MAG: hypothetical protein A3J10_03435 [Candidatus Sungbacteria bacterium RIFCSPLOWO2_02_FULL_54_10]|uniref:Gfo/Idh/MocA-like oxidoreductase N-terminal domain-containing protein n=2 Tax=Candidatus Sungiibacteriota TaxID=1817917 RepID=A0A1G2L8L6_9BACT|nr:MAG: hypothetical protein A3C92_03625 [Candidatus Sungbacteria bacterium RIFCSPHIGHO2_02_FULL_53_17]OHA07983.1 MAG: hypothetical protein A3B34_00935 [Candidatus Sungbacteria bacterium RIFCSPLOWO2_01_FULL_54_21]OHA13538.1 MAG: hypothetical protein A3J10_03435 [Candidatus Sungbacteria bacterium RIFCSPLOWO2_02_FULL_54_10]